MRSKDHCVEMADHFTNWLFHPIEQNFLAKTLAIQHSHWFENQTRLQAMFAFSALIFSDKPGDRKPPLLCFVKVDNLAVSVGLKRSECREEINGFQHAGLALRVISREH